MSHGGIALPLDGMLASYRRDARARHVGRRELPSRDEIVEIVRLLLQLFYPGYYGRQDLTEENLAVHVETLLASLREKLLRQVESSLACASDDAGEPADACGEKARVATAALLSRLPAIRDALVLDAQAAYDGDPAAQSLDEIILAYPGFLAVTVHRVAHELYALGVPLLPRILSEWAHTRSGADIHPGATIGPRFFIDHATGVVVGETARIGADAKLYQGVTLGALSHPRDAEGRVVRGTKRHPTVENDVTLYANATILGGETVVGSNSVVGGSVFLTRSVPAGSRVAIKPPELAVRGSEPVALDFEI